CHEGLFDAKVTVEDFHDRGGGVGRAACARQAVNAAVRPVHAVDDGREVLILRARGEDDPLRACLSVLLQVFTAGDNTRALEHDLDVHLLPGELRGVALLQEAYATLAVDHEVVPVELYRPVIAPVDGVILKQIGNIRGVGDVVDGDQFKLRGVHQNL